MSSNLFCDAVLIRHGETAWNKLGIQQGHFDEPLDEKGVQQAEELRDTLAGTDFSAAFSSDLSRAFKTCMIVLGRRDVTIQKTEKLRERTFLEWEQHKRAELKAKVKELGAGITPGLTQKEFLAFKLFDKIESYGEIYKRASEYLQAQVIPNVGKTILVSSHGGVVNSFLDTLDFRQGYFWHVPNCSFLKLRIFQDGTIKLLDMHGPSLTTEQTSLW